MGDNMIIDEYTGIELVPGNNGEDCYGNGLHIDDDGRLIECCCNECNYGLCCVDDMCVNCTIPKSECPRDEEYDPF